MKPTIICIVGAQASGKSTLEKWMSDTLGIKRLISHTTRPRRDTDQEDEYHFVTDEEFEALCDKDGGFVEKRHYTVAGGDVWKYGIHRSSVTERVHVAVVDYQGYIDLREEYNTMGLHLVITPEESIRRVKKFRPSYPLDEAYRRIADDIKAVIEPASEDPLMNQVPSQPTIEGTREVVKEYVVRVLAHSKAQEQQELRRAEASENFKTRDPNYGY